MIVKATVHLLVSLHHFLRIQSVRWLNETIKQEKLRKIWSE
jgi:hypothetical protein